MESGMIAAESIVENFISGSANEDLSNYQEKN